ncbi:MAG: hypothetical protein ABJA02_08380 [Acidobacteriota bacterium]
MLRSFLGISVSAQTAFYLSAQENPSFWIVLGCLAGLGCGSFLLAGFLTPVVASVTCLAAAYILASGVGSSPPVLSGINLSAVCSVIVSTAIIFLGPGAFSVDARLFGRREIRIPPSNRHPEA